MPTLSKDAPRVFSGPFVENSLPMIDNDIIYAGAAVGDNASGLARPLVAADPFIGFATEKADNTGTGHAASAIDVKLRSEGFVELLVVGATSAADEGEKVYATDDNTFTMTASGASAIGRIHKWSNDAVATTKCVVRFQAASMIDHT